MKRKILSLILVFAMTVSLLTVGTGAVEPTYGDTKGHWAESSIERWSGHGIVQGSNGEFDPNGQLTCAQLATILACLLKLPAAASAGFTDVKSDAWYADAIDRCAAAGILNGNGDGTVSPTAPITRERAMVMLGRALGIQPVENPDLSKYGDAAKVSAYAQGYVAAMIEAGIVTGVGGDQIAPQDDINRASTVTILDRAIAVYADKDGATIDAKDGGLILVVAENVKVVNAPEGTTVVAADGASGLTVNDQAVTDDQTYVVPKTEPAKPSGGSSSGGSYTPPHTHSYVYSTDWDTTLVSTKSCSCGNSTETVEGIYYIANDAELGKFRDWVNGTNGKTATDFAGKTIELTDGVDLSGVENWAPIGTSTNPFKGVFDGKGKTISNLKITGGGYIGLFGYVGDGAAIKNVNLVGADVSGTERVGGLIGKIISNTTVSNCSIDETSHIFGTDSNTGGFIGEAVNGTAISLSGLTNKAVVTNTASSNARAGGIVGQVTTNANVTITDCRNEGAIIAENGYAGGIVSAYQNGALTINSCANSGTLTGTYKGDLVAWITSVRSLYQWVR